MILSEKINDKLVCYYSDLKFMIREKNLDQIYEKAVCPINNSFEFEETDIEIEKEENYKQLAEYYKLLLDTITGEESEK